MLKQQKSGATCCFVCNQIVSLDAPKCVHCGQPYPALWGYSRSLRRLGLDFGFLNVILASCILLFGATLLSDIDGIQNQGFLNFLSPSGISLLRFGATGSIPVFQLGRWWTVLSAGWLHGGLLHIVFNLLWIRSLAPTVAQEYGAGRLISIYIGAMITGCLLSSSVGQFLPMLPSFLHGAHISIGASGAVFGLVGALVSYGQRTGRAEVKQQALNLALVMFVFGFVMANVDNWGHLGGFLGGYLLTRTPWFDPQRPQHIYHLLLGLGLILLSFLSIVISIVIVPGTI